MVLRWVVLLALMLPAQAEPLQFVVDCRSSN